LGYHRKMVALSYFIDMFKKLREWREKRKQTYLDNQWNRGFLWAWDALQAGEECPASLESKWWHNPFPCEFDYGASDAADVLIKLGVIEDNT
jgi:hypothetical protein